MNAVLEKSTLQVMQVLVVGRIEHTEVYEGKHSSRCITPSSDVYSRPQIVMVRSKARIGRVGDEVSVVCKLGGYVRKPYKITDKATGEIFSVTPVDMTLDTID